MARNSVCKKSVVVDESGMAAGAKWVFADGKVVVLMLTDLGMTMLNRAAVHGILQKGGDSYSGISNVTEARMALESTLKAIMDDDWNRRPDRIGILAEALHRATGQPMDEVVRKLQSLDDKAKRELAKHDQVAVLIKEIELERAKARVDDTDEAPELDF